MLTIKLSRIGKKRQPSYRLIIVEKVKDTQGRYLENVGFYNPCAVPPVLQLKEERIKYWIARGAQATPTIHNFLVGKKIIQGKKVNVVKTKKKEVNGQEKTEKKKAEGKKEVTAPALSEEKPQEKK